MGGVYRLLIVCMLVGSGAALALTKAEKLIRDLGSREVRTRSSAAWDLGQIGAVEAIPALVDALGDDARSVRANAASSLGRLGDDAQVAIAALRQVLDDSYAPVAANAVSSLRKLGIPREEFEAVYRRLLGESDCAMRLRGVRGLRGLAAEAELVAPTFACTHGAEDLDERLDAGDLLRSMIADRALAPVLINLLAAAGEVRVVDLLLGLSSYAPPVYEGIPAVRSYLSSADPENRGMAAVALGRMGATGTAVEVAALMGSDPDPKVRERAAGALGDMGPAAAATVPQLVDAAQDERWPDVREAALRALGAMGEAAAAARPALYAALESGDGFVRIAARNALFRVDPENKDEVVRLADAAAAAPPPGGASDQLFEDTTGLPEALTQGMSDIVELNVYADFAIVVAPDASSPTGWGRFTYRAGVLGGPEEGTPGCDKTFAIADADLNALPALIADALKRSGGGATVIVATLSRGVFCRKPGWMIVLDGGTNASRVEYQLNGKLQKVWP